MSIPILFSLILVGSFLEGSWGFDIQAFLASKKKHSIVLPLTPSRYCVESNQRLLAAFDTMVEGISSECGFVPVTQSVVQEYTIPLLGDDCVLTFVPPAAPSLGDLDATTTTAGAPPMEFVLSLEGAQTTEEDFGWICQKFYESRATFDDDHGFQLLDLSSLREEVFQHVNSNNQPSHPGNLASDSKQSSHNNDNVMEQLFQTSLSSASNSKEVLQELQSKGFVQLHGGPKTSDQSNMNLSKYLLQKTGQGRKIRRDTVAFLDREQAKPCGLEGHCDLLMGMADYLNRHLDLSFIDSSTGYAPIAPATILAPLTTPSKIQAAEYGLGDFYVAHSDNSWYKDNKGEDSLTTRRNYRCYTAILYCNDDWEESDGGALRIYHDSQHYSRVSEAVTTDPTKYTDVIPTNGRLVIFDSKLVHSVEPVLTDRRRRALTVWILQPTDEPVLGEIVDVPL
ncbi:2OG-Fe(II) oxygenase [Seminavis robusta]|uniref:2OG-Fe(II) oxygenase n=1 Tax=Seminavis robusta TaxID=568900 RepID=A0A9N8D8T8_9STRA|nr:2OG-Fe(II) oxygenase [Seminavis robusta]|eukprot:Sro3_g002670.1 2OG-Fe(II) oxygenase (452) ;mRNA; r:213801-215156